MALAARVLQPDSELGLGDRAPGRAKRALRWQPAPHGNLEEAFERERPGGGELRSCRPDDEQGADDDRRRLTNLEVRYGGTNGGPHPDGIVDDRDPLAAKGGSQRRWNPVVDRVQARSLTDDSLRECEPHAKL